MRTKKTLLLKSVYAKSLLNQKFPVEDVLGLTSIHQAYVDHDFVEVINLKTNGKKSGYILHVGDIEIRIGLTDLINDVLDLNLTNPDSQAEALIQFSKILRRALQDFRRMIDLNCSEFANSDTIYEICLHWRYAVNSTQIFERSKNKPQAEEMINLLAKCLFEEYFSHINIHAKKAWIISPSVALSRAQSF